MEKYGENFDINYVLSRFEPGFTLSLIISYADLVNNHPSFGPVTLKFGPFP